MEKQRNNYHLNEKKIEIKGARTSTKGNYRGSKKSRENAWKTVKRYMAFMVIAGGIAGYAAGATTGPMISKLAENFKSQKNTQMSVELAAQYDNYLEIVKSNLEQREDSIENTTGANEYAETTKRLLQIEKQDKVEGLTELNNAVKIYNELRYKKDRSFNEEKEFLEACQKICESEQVVIDVYSDSISEKVADVYGIRDEYSKSQIKVSAPGHFNNAKGRYEYSAQIDIPGKSTKLSKDLQEQVINARSLLDEPYSFNSMSIDELPVDKIIDVYQDAIEFEDYNITVEKDGELVMTSRDKAESKTKSEERVEKAEVEEER